MELTRQQKQAIYQKLSHDFAELRLTSHKTPEMVSTYSEVGLSNLEHFENRSSDLGNIKLYVLINWASIFGKKIRFEFEDIITEDKLASLQLINFKVKELNRLLG